MGKQQTKVYYSGPMFRYERPQAGRLRQFYQIGVEAVGGDHKDKAFQLQSDYQIIMGAWKGICEIFPEQIQFQLHINNLGDREALKQYNEAIGKFLVQYKSSLSEVSQMRLDAGNSLRILDSKQDQEFLATIETSAPKMEAFVSQSQRDQFSELMDLLQFSGVNVHHDHKLVRGLDYYNGTCFEIKCLSPVADTVLGKSQNTVLAGGRYDDLSLQFVNKSIPAVGWAAGTDRLALLLQATQNPDAVDQKKQKKLVVASFL